MNGSGPFQYYRMNIYPRTGLRVPYPRRRHYTNVAALLSAAGNNTYDETATGGVVVAGNAIDERIGFNEPYNEIGSGGTVVGGSATDNVISSEAAAGGVVLAGNALSEILVFAAGGVVLAGNASDNVRSSEVATGGAVLAGSAVDNVISSETATNGMVLSGHWSFINSITAAPGSGGGTTGSMDTTGSDTIFIAVASYTPGGTAFTVSDSNSNTWFPLTAYTGSSSAIKIYYAKDCIVGPSHTFTVTRAGTYPAIMVMAFSGGHATTPFDLANGDTASSSPISTGSVIPSENKELLISGITFSTTFGSLAIDSGFTLQDERAYLNAINMGGATAYKIQTAAGAENPAWSFSGTPTVAATIATFKVWVGAAIDNVISSEIGSGGAVLAGSAVDNVISSETAAGGVVVSGVASSEVLIYSTGGVAVNGSAVDNVRSSETAAGGVVVAGSATDNVISSEVATGGVLVSDTRQETKTPANFTNYLSAVWVNPENAGASDDAYAYFVAIPDNSGRSFYLRGTNSGFTIPNDATITGLVLEVELHSSNGFVSDSHVYLDEFAQDKFNWEQWPETDTTFVYGGTSDLWGTTWTPAKVNAVGFGVWYYAIGNTDDGAIGYVDHIQITVDYHIPHEYVITAKTANGGAVLAGSAVDNVRSSETATGGVVASGVASSEVLIYSTGGVAVNGSAVDNVRSSETATGGVVASGVASSEVLIYSTGGVAVNGSAVDNVRSSETATGGVVLAGSALSEIIVFATGGVVLAGNAIDEHVVGGNTYNETATGGTVVAGSATDNVISSEFATGGVVVAGSATDNVISSEFATGGVVVAGSATDNVISSEFATGGVVVAGDAILSVVRSDTATGGVVVAGDAILSVVRSDTATGGVVVTGSKQVTSQGPKNTGTGADDASVGTSTWSNTGNVVSSNDTYATPGTLGITHYLKGTNFGFSVSGTITAVVFEIERKSTLASATDNRIHMVIGGTIQTSVNKSAGATWPTSEAYASFTFDIPEDIALTATQVNASDFGVAISANANTDVVYVDHIRATVYYEIDESNVYVIYNPEQSGGSLANSTDVDKVRSFEIAIGGAVVNGNAIESETNVFNETSLGGVVVDGSAIDNIISSNTATGGIVVAGESVTAESEDRTAEGGAVLAGSALDNIIVSETATGGVVLNGTAINTVISSEIVTGGVILNGSAIDEHVVTGNTYNETAEGGVVVAGDSLLFKSYIDAATGGIVVNGSDVDVSQSSETATGGIVVGDSALDNIIVSETTTGGVVVTGEVVGNIYEEVASGGIVVNGTATDSIISLEAALGGVVVNGSEISATTYSETAIGGIIVNGSAIDEFILTEPAPCSSSPGAPGHPNWYNCNGELNRGCFTPACCDPPRGHRYEFPLPKIPASPVPSIANYDPKNVAWLIEFFGGILGVDHMEVGFRYENNTPEDRCRPLEESDDIFVTHPGDKLYLPEKEKCKVKSPEQKRYEKFAKKSKLLKLYEKHSPANITYFNECSPT